MKLSGFGTFTVIACAMAVSLSAQNPPPPAGGQAPSASSASKVTVTGCLEKGQASAAPTGTSGGAGAASTFVLNNAMAGGGAAAPGAAGTSGAARTTASSYRLDGESSTLSPHVGHKVEITGTVQAAPATGKTDPPAPASGAPRLKVEAVKMIASSCTP
jgi:hypothetical protein